MDRRLRSGKFVFETFLNEFLVLNVNILCEVKLRLKEKRKVKVNNNENIFIE